MQRKPRKFGRRYPWRMWFDKGRFTLEKGKHFKVRTSVMVQMVRDTASRGYDGVPPCRVSIKVHEDESFTVTVQRVRQADATTWSEGTGPDDVPGY